jgi:hypothetical protein
LVSLLVRQAKPSTLKSRQGTGERESFASGSPTTIIKQNRGRTAPG